MLAPTPCLDCGAPATRRGRCPQHQQPAWAGSSRARRLPNDWATRRRITRHRAGDRCQALDHAPGCTGLGTECDHIVNNDDHALGNLQWLSAPCHRAKTQREANAR